MSSDVVIKNLSNEDIAEIAKNFLEKHNRTKQIPVPIEEIIEIELQIRFIPVPELKKQFDIEGFISSDFSTITIDNQTFMSYPPNRARFTLAHELRHYVLHQNIYKEHGVLDIDSFVDFSNGINDKDWRKIESQAHVFAGYFLMPRDHFRAVVNELMDGIQILSISDLRSIVERISTTFLVSGECAYRQLEKEYNVKDVVI